MEHINPRNLNINRRKRQSPSNIPEGVSIEVTLCVYVCLPYLLPGVTPLCS